MIAEKVMHKIEKPFKCIYCNTSYSKEKTLFAHMCEKKRRALQKGEKRVQLGFYAYNQFYKLTSHCTKNKTYDNFMQSPYYNAFVKFGSYIANVQPLYTEQYIDYIVTSGIKLEHWCKDELYETYALNLIKKEHVSVALERTVLTMVEWAGNNPPAVWNHYFNFVSLSKVHLIPVSCSLITLSKLYLSFKNLNISKASPYKIFKCKLFFVNWC